jgi:hypothetical protein
MGRRSYLARLAAPLGEAGPVLFPVPQAAPEEARPAWRAGAAAGAEDAGPAVRRGRKSDSVKPAEVLAAQGNQAAAGAAPAAAGPVAAGPAFAASAVAAPAVAAPEIAGPDMSGPPSAPAGQASGAILRRKPARDHAPAPRSAASGEPTAVLPWPAGVSAETGAVSPKPVPKAAPTKEASPLGDAAPPLNGRAQALTAWAAPFVPPAREAGAARALPGKIGPREAAPVARAEPGLPEPGLPAPGLPAPGLPARGVAAPEPASGPRIHIGTVEVRMANAPPPAAPPPPMRPAAAPAGSAPPARLATGYGWRFGLFQG